jgi:hypothetical protein
MMSQKLLMDVITTMSSSFKEIAHPNIKKMFSIIEWDVFESKTNFVDRIKKKIGSH